jgi:hypothetical protein
MSRYTPEDRRNHRAGIVAKPAKAPRTLDDRARELMRQNHMLGRNSANAQALAEQAEQEGH